MISPVRNSEAVTPTSRTVDQDYVAAAHGTGGKGRNACTEKKAQCQGKGQEGQLYSTGNKHIAASLVSGSERDMQLARNAATIL